jgi:preprotein translocase subunit SecG
MEKVLFWAVVVWMVGLLVLGIIAVRDIWKDTIDSEKNLANAPEKSNSDGSIQTYEKVQNTENQTPTA